MDPIADARREVALEIQKLAEDFERDDEAAFRHGDRHDRDRRGRAGDPDPANDTLIYISFLRQVQKARQDSCR